MDFSDRTLVQLADSNVRDALFSDAALLRIAEAAYDADALALEGPFSALFDRLDLGVSLDRSLDVDGGWAQPGTAVRTDLRVSIRGATSSVEAIDALWEGSIVARAVDATARIVAVETPDVDFTAVDDSVAASLGALPTDPVALEAARRAEILARLRAPLDEPEGVDLNDLPALFRGLGATDAAGFLQALATGAVLPLRLAFSDASGAQPSPMRLPITAAVLVLDGPLQIGDALRRSRRLLSRLAARGAAPPPDPALPRRNALLVLWLVPEAVLDDTDWPGGDAGNAAARRAARADAAQSWLAPLGIVLIPLP